MNQTRVLKLKKKEESAGGIDYTAGCRSSDPKALARPRASLKISGHHCRMGWPLGLGLGFENYTQELSYCTGDVQSHPILGLRLGCVDWLQEPSYCARSQRQTNCDGIRSGRPVQTFPCAMISSMSASVIDVSLLRNTLSAPNLKASNSCSLPSYNIHTHIQQQRQTKNNDSLNTLFFK